MARRSWEREDDRAHFGPYDEGLQVVDVYTRPSKQCSDSKGLQVTLTHQPSPMVHDRPSTLYSDSEGLQWTPQPYLGKLADMAFVNEEKPNEGKEAVQMNPEYQSGMEPCVLDSERKAPVYVPTPNSRRVKVWILAAVIAIIITVCGVAIPVTISTSQDRSPVSNNSSTPSDLSTSGAFDRSGLATMNPENGENQIWVVWQDYTGAVALSRKTSGLWQSPQFLQLENVMNGTYLEAISYSASNVTHVRTR